MSYMKFPRLFCHKRLEERQVSPFSPHFTIVYCLASSKLRPKRLQAPRRAAHRQEARDDAVEHGPEIREPLAALAPAPLARAEAAEVLGGFREPIAVEIELQAARGLAIEGDLEEDLSADAARRREGRMAWKWDEMMIKPLKIIENASLKPCETVSRAFGLVSSTFLTAPAASEGGFLDSSE